MIDLKFGLYWSGEKISYLRYLTFKSIRYFHPTSVIELYINKNYKFKKRWREEIQDFQIEDSGFKKLVDIEELKHLGVNIIEIDKFSEYSPNYQSDFFRWWWLNNNNGFYLDTDIIMLKSLNDLNREYDFITTHYILSWGRAYFPVGFIGNNNSEIVKYTEEILKKYYDEKDYNSLGPWAFHSIYMSKIWKDNVYFTPPEYFYPVKESQYMPIYYKNNVKLSDNAYCLHWFGGLPQSQKYNLDFDEEYIKNSDDTISNIVKKFNYFDYGSVT